MSSAANKIDDDISAAFTDAPQAAPSAAIDDDIAAAFAASHDPNAPVSFDEGIRRGARAAIEGVTGIGENVVSGLSGAAGSLADVVTGSAPGAHAWAYQPRTGAGKVIQKELSKAASAVGQVANEDLIAPATQAWGGDPEAMRQTLAERVPEALGATSALAPLNLLRPKPAAALPALDAQGVATRAADQQSMGAAGAAPDVSQASPPIRAAIAAADPAKVDQTAMLNHLEADEHGVPLMKGQANRDPVQFSNEQNSTHKDIVGRINQQNGAMVDALDTIRRDASPTTVHNDVIQNGRAVVDDLKAYDEPVQADIRAKYKALEDANGGSLPIDTGAFLSKVDTALKKQYLTDDVPPAAANFLKSIRSGEPLDFEGFEAARSRLAEAQRSGGSAGAAAKIIRGELEQMPLPPEAAKLKGLADTARAAAKARFDALDADPAYQAAVDDIAAGNKRGAPSPIADKFIDNYALGNAPKSQVDLMMSKLGDEGRGAVATHTLNAFRKSAVNSNGVIQPRGIPDALVKYGPKLDSLVSPETRASVESLGRVVSNAKSPPPGNFVNYSKSGVIMNAAKGMGESAVNAKTLGLGVPILRNILGDQFAKDALAPGAGIERD